MDYMKEINYLFMCSVCRCTDEVETNLLSDAVKKMRQVGWRIGKEKNICPKCKEKKQAIKESR